MKNWFSRSKWAFLFARLSSLFVFPYDLLFRITDSIHIRKGKSQNFAHLFLMKEFMNNASIWDSSWKGSPSAKSNNWFPLYVVQQYKKSGHFTCNYFPGLHSNWNRYTEVPQYYTYIQVCIVYISYHIFYQKYMW